MLIRAKLQALRETEPHVHQESLELLHPTPQNQYTDTQAVTSEGSQAINTHRRLGELLPLTAFILGGKLENTDL